MITFEAWLDKNKASLDAPLAYRPGYEALAYRTAHRLYENVSRYTALQTYCGGTVPVVFFMCAHERESDGAWNTYLGNGERLDRVTTMVPTGRGPFASFEDGAKDAVKIEGLDRRTNWTRAELAFELEGFNGFGYYYKGLPSPYIWAGSTIQRPGKYVADGLFDPTVMDPQLGALLVYDQLVQLYPALALP